MKKLLFDPSWPDSWKYCFNYDRQEIYGECLNPGYFLSYQIRSERILTLVKLHLSEGSSIIDVAAAQGNFSLRLAELGYKVTWNDIRKDLRGYVELKREFGDITFVPGNIMEQTFPALFDAALVTEVIEHVAHPDLFLAQIAALIRPGGFIFLTTPNGRYFRNTLPRFTDFSNPEVFEAVEFGPNADDHIFLLHPDEISLLARKANLSLLHLDLTTSFFCAGHLKLHKLLTHLPRQFPHLVEKCCKYLPELVRSRITTNIVAVFQKK